MAYDPQQQGGQYPEQVGSATPPGWYSDPQAPGMQRYWDGSQWTENRAPVAHAGAGGGVGPPTNGKATASMVLGILGLLFLYLIGPVLALIFGYQAKNEIEASGGAQGGRGMAIAGIVMGWIGIGFAILFLLIWLITGAIIFSAS
jgi:hypothetical protein